MSNHKQLTLAWIMHADDNAEKLAYSGPADNNYDPNAWVCGYLNFDPANPSNWDVSRDLERSPLWPYCGQSVGIFRCPADKSKVRPSSGPFQGKEVARVRSMSMTGWMGGFAGQWWQSPPFKLYLRLSDIVDPGPSMTEVFWDQREDSINTGNFDIDMTGYPNSPQSVQFGQDYPASYHNRAGGLSFADGHSEIRRWRDPRTMPSLRKGSNWLMTAGGVSSPNNQDIIWLQERATRRMGGFR